MVMERFGKYILVDKISSGGMADVLRAKVVGIRGFTKTVAIKRIHPHLLERTRFLRMFTDEAKIASRLVHPNIVQIFDLGEADGLPYIAMEYVPGRDVFRVLQRLGSLDRRCPWRLATKIVAEVCTGLQFAHEFRSPDGQPQEIVHRDVSPRNIIITYNGEIRLTDFGVARARDREEHTEHGVIKGKVRYLSPEAAHAKEVDRRSDLFSLGIVFAEMLLMAPLRTGDNEMAMLLDIRKGEFDTTRFDEISKPLREVLYRALEVDPEDRYSSAREFADNLASRYDRESTPMNEAEVATFMHSLFAEDIEKEGARDEEVERELGKMIVDTTVPVATTDAQPQAPTGSLRNPLNIFAGRGAGPVAVPAVEVVEERPPLPDREGTLHEVTLCRLLHQLNEAGTTGVIDFNRDPIKKSIVLENGNPVFATSNVETELFGEHLVANGFLSREQHGETLDFAARKGLRFTEALLALGACTPNILFQQLGGQVRDRILDLFSWITGTFQFYENTPVPDTGLPLNLRTHTLIHEGVQERMPLVVIRRFMEGRSQQQVLRVPGEIPVDLQLSGRQQRILRNIEDGEITVAELVRREKDEEWMLRLLYMLHEIQRIIFRD
ncbi:MAG: protein kinase [Acidobacteria bacterium]|nr:protein kinase [Candidatus Sulfomarinibacter sp. MAG AM1]